LYEQKQKLVRSLELEKQAEETARIKAQEALDAAHNAGEREAEALQAKKETEAEKKKADDAAKLAQKQRDQARGHLFTAQLMRVAAVYEKDPQKGLGLLHDCDACPIGLRDVAWRYYENACRGQKPRTLDLGGGEFLDASLAFSPDGKALASARGAAAVHLWEVATGKQRAVLKGHGGGVRCVAFSPDGQTLASGNWDGTVRLWEVATGK